MTQRTEFAHRDRRRPQRAFTRVPNYAPPELVVEISRRVRIVCPSWPEREFSELVQRMAHIQWKFEARGGGDALSSLPERHWRM